MWGGSDKTPGGWGRVPSQPWGGRRTPFGPVIPGEVPYGSIRPVGEGKGDLKEAGEGLTKIGRAGSVTGAWAENAASLFRKVAHPKFTHAAPVLAWKLAPAAASETKIIRPVQSAAVGIVATVNSGQ